MGLAASTLEMVRYKTRCLLTAHSRGHVILDHWSRKVNGRYYKSRHDVGSEVKKHQVEARSVIRACFPYWKGIGLKGGTLWQSAHGSDTWHRVSIAEPGNFAQLNLFIRDNFNIKQNKLLDHVARVVHMPDCCRNLGHSCVILSFLVLYCVSSMVDLFPKFWNARIGKFGPAFCASDGESAVLFRLALAFVKLHLQSVKQ